MKFIRFVYSCIRLYFRRHSVSNDFVNRCSRYYIVCYGEVEPLVVAFSIELSAALFLAEKYSLYFQSSGRSVPVAVFDTLDNSAKPVKVYV